MNSILSTLTDSQVDKLIDILKDVIGALSSAAAIIIPALVLYFQKRNRNDAKMEAQAQLAAIMSTSDFMRMVHTASPVPTTKNAIYHRIILPGMEWEKYPLSSGSNVQWKREISEKGRTISFRIEGSVEMGWHFIRQTSEMRVILAGEMTVRTVGEIVHLKKGDSYMIPSNVVRSASIPNSVEFTCYSNELENDFIDIGIFPAVDTISGQLFIPKS